MLVGNGVSALSKRHGGCLLDSSGICRWRWSSLARGIPSCRWSRQEQNTSHPRLEHKGAIQITPTSKYNKLPDLTVQCDEAYRDTLLAEWYSIRALSPSDTAPHGRNTSARHRLHLMRTIVALSMCSQGVRCRLMHLAQRRQVQSNCTNGSV